MRALALCMLLLVASVALGQTTTSVPDKVATGLNPAHTDIFPYAIHNSAFSPDGKRLAAGLGDGRVLVWHLRADAPPVDIKAHDDWTFSIAWSPDGSLMVTGGGDNVIRAWDASKLSNDAKAIFELKGHTNDVHAVAFTPDGKMLVSTGDDKTAIVWDMQTRKALRVLSEHQRPIPTLAVSADGAQLATGSRDGLVIIWNIQTGQVTQRLRASNGRDVMSVKFSRDGNEVIAAGYDGVLRVWDLPGRKLARSLSTKNEIFSVALEADGKSIIFASTDGVYEWSGVSGEPARKIYTAANDEQISHTSVSPDGQIAATSTLGKIYLIGADRKVPPRVLINPQAPQLKSK
jgi:WD40 repeat protein